MNKLEYVKNNKDFIDNLIDELELPAINGYQQAFYLKARQQGMNANRFKVRYINPQTFWAEPEKEKSKEPMIFKDGIWVDNE